MSNLNTNVIELKRRLEEGKIDECFKILNKSIFKNSIYSDEITLLLSRYNRFKNRSIIGVGNDNEELAKICFEILGLCKVFSSNFRNNKEANKEFQIISEHEYAILRIITSELSYKATFWGLLTSKRGLNNLVRTDAYISFFSANIFAIKRDLKLKRIFILSKKEYLNKDGNFIDKEAYEFIKKHVDIGVNVKIGFIEDFYDMKLSKDTLYDFAIIDGKGVGKNCFGPIGNFTEAIYNENIDYVKKHETKFLNLWANSIDFSTIQLI